VFVVTEGGGGTALPRATPIQQAMRSRTTAYLLASLIAAAGVAVALWLDEVTGNTLFMSMLLAVVVAVWLFGPGPGWVSLLVTSVASPLVVEPAGGYLVLNETSWILVGAYVLIGVVVVVLGWARARARRSTAGAVSQSEDQRRRFASALDAMPNGLIVVDSVGRIILANSKATDILGSAIEGMDLLTDPRFMTGHTTDGQRTTVEESALLRSLRGDEVVQGEEIEVRRSDGSHRVIRTSSAPYYTESGAVGGAVVVFADVTARRAADNQARLASEVAVILDRTVEVEEGLLAVASLMVPGTADYCVIALTDPPRVVAVRHEDPDRQAAAEKLVALWPVTPDLPGTAYHVMETGLGHCEPEIPLDEYLEAARSLGESGLADLVAEIHPRSQLIVPMRARGRVVGCLLLAMAESGRRFGDDLPRFQELADRLGLMTDNAMLFAAAGEAKRQAEMTGGRLEVLQQATAGAAQALTVDEVLDNAIDSGLAALDADVGWVAVPSAEGVELLHEKWWGTEAAQGSSRRRHLPPKHPFAYVVRTGRPLWYPDAGLLTRRFPDGLDPIPSRFASIAVVPINLGPGTVGALAAGFTRRATFPTEDRSYLAALAAVTARSMERARRYEEEHEAAQTLQQSLLPRMLPRAPWLRLHARYIPAQERTAAGGDWYDAIRVGPDRMALTVGDVVGKGIAAAAIMGQLRSVLNAALREGSSPADALTRLSRLATDVPGATGTTAAVVLYERPGGLVRYTCAGQLPPLLVGSQGPRFLEEARSVPLGVLDVDLVEAGVHVEPGDMLVLYSDGLVERRDESIDVGLERLLDGASSLLGESMAAFCDELIARMVGEHTADDVTLLAAEFEPRRRSSPRTRT
jgi:PAS domain S-box-containing protein